MEDIDFIDINRYLIGIKTEKYMNYLLGEIRKERMPIPLRDKVRGKKSLPGLRQSAIEEFGKKDDIHKYIDELEEDITEFRDSTIKFSKESYNPGEEINAYKNFIEEYKNFNKTANDKFKKLDEASHKRGDHELIISVLKLQLRLKEYNESINPEITNIEKIIDESDVGYL